MKVIPLGMRHEGADGLIVIATPERMTGYIRDNVVTGFDEAISRRHEEEDPCQGYCVRYDRQGNEVAFPLMRLSAATVTNERTKMVHPAQIARIASEVLKCAKTAAGNNYRFDMRRNNE